MDAEWIFFATGHGKSWHVMVLVDLLNVMLWNIVYKDPSLHDQILSYQSMLDLCVREIPLKL